MTAAKAHVEEEEEIRVWMFATYVFTDHKEREKGIFITAIDIDTPSNVFHVDKDKKEAILLPYEESCFFKYMDKKLLLKQLTGIYDVGVRDVMVTHDILDKNHALLCLPREFSLKRFYTDRKFYEIFKIKHNQT